MWQRWHPNQSGRCGETRSGTVTIVSPHFGQRQPTGVNSSPIGVSGTSSVTAICEAENFVPRMSRHLRVLSRTLLPHEIHDFQP